MYLLIIFTTSEKFWKRLLSVSTRLKFSIKYFKPAINKTDNLILNAMVSTFLKAKHWQLFLLTFGIPLILELALMATMIANRGNDTDLSFMFAYAKIFPIIMVLFMGVWFGWFWSVAIGLQPRVPEDVVMKVNKFKVFFFTPLIYILLLATVFSLFTTGNGRNPGIFALIVPLHLFSIFCMFYILYFVSKTIKTVELQREVSFSDFAGEFFMIWFFPIGIWIVQPKINKMVRE
ncbi:MAG: hypothetical protein SF052_02075 [Bacteroidia bacterium]|nr:hypothetical protein [Bacteroidia bacterium]